jgi:hypothetical protein
MTHPTCRACRHPIGVAFSCVERTGCTRFGEDIEDQGIEPGDRCRDCGVADGGAHHPGCCVPWCTYCNYQRLVCGCDWEDEELVPQ